MSRYTLVWVVLWTLGGESRRMRSGVGSLEGRDREQSAAVEELIRSAADLVVERTGEQDRSLDDSLLEPIDVDGLRQVRESERPFEKRLRGEREQARQGLTADYGIGTTPTLVRPPPPPSGDHWRDERLNMCVMCTGR